MSTREQLKPTKVIDAASMAASVTSKPTVIPGLSMISYDVSWSGTSPVGVLSVEWSNTAKFDSQGNYIASTGNWYTLPFENSAGSIVTSIAVAGNTGSAGINLSDLSFNAIRLVYTRTSGIGALTAVVSGKVA